MIWRGKECLHLVLMRDPFERIANGDKVIEYRDRTDYWNRRLFGKDIKWIFFIPFAILSKGSFIKTKCKHSFSPQIIIYSKDEV